MKKITTIAASAFALVGGSAIAFAAHAATFAAHAAQNPNIQEAACYYEYYWNGFYYVYSYICG